MSTDKAAASRTRAVSTQELIICRLEVAIISAAVRPFLWNTPSSFFGTAFIWNPSVSEVRSRC